VGPATSTKAAPAKPEPKPAESPAPTAEDERSPLQKLVDKFK
jgi:hypothetical protein